MRNFLASTALALAMGTAALAESHMSAYVASPHAGDIRGSEFIGMRIYATEAAPTEIEIMQVDNNRLIYEGAEREWNDIGEVNDVLLTREGDVRAVLVDVGGFLGIGEKTVAVSMDQFRFVREGNDGANGDFFLVVNSSQEMLESAPAYENVEAAEQTDRTATTQGDTEMQTDRTAAAQAELKDDTAQAEMKGDTAQADPNYPGVMRDFKLEGFDRVEHAALTTEDLTGARVYGINNEDVGEIDRLLLADTNKISQAVIDVGGFLGMGEHSVAVDINELSIQRSKDGGDIRVYIDASEEKLKQLPEYDG